MLLLPKPVVLTGQSRHGGVHGNVREKGGVRVEKEKRKRKKCSSVRPRFLREAERERERERARFYVKPNPDTNLDRLDCQRFWPSTSYLLYLLNRYFEMRYAGVRRRSAERTYLVPIYVEWSQHSLRSTEPGPGGDIHRCITTHNV